MEISPKVILVAAVTALSLPVAAVAASSPLWVFVLMSSAPAALIVWYFIEGRGLRKRQPQLTLSPTVEDRDYPRDRPIRFFQIPYDPGPSADLFETPYESTSASVIPERMASPSAPSGAHMHVSGSVPEETATQSWHLYIHVKNAEGRTPANHLVAKIRFVRDNSETRGWESARWASNRDESAASTQRAQAVRIEGGGHDKVDVACKPVGDDECYVYDQLQYTRGGCTREDNNLGHEPLTVEVSLVGENIKEIRRTYALDPRKSGEAPTFIEQV